MKHLIIVPTFFILVFLSGVIGALCYLWRFKNSDFERGFKWLNTKIRFVRFFDRHLPEFIN